MRNENKKINALAFSPGGASILVAYDDSIARIWNLQNGNYIELRGHSNEITSAAFSKDGNTFYNSFSHR